MLRLEGNRDVRFCDGWTRRDFLTAGGLAAGLTLTELASLERAGAASGTSEMSCIQLFLVGGPSHLDTWDLKPDAPDYIRGPYRPARTVVPGLQIGEHFPRMARIADQFALIRSIYHKEAPVHETGHQLLQTGRLFRPGLEHPHYGAILGAMRPTTRDVPPWVLLPGPIGNTGVAVSHGQSAAFLGRDLDPFTPPDVPRLADTASPYGLDPARLESADAIVRAVDGAQRRSESSSQRVEGVDLLFSSHAKRAFRIDHEPEAVRERYGENTFGQSCLLARRLVEQGVRLVTVNMFDTVFNRTTWDCHANGGDLNSTLDDYGRTLCPMLDIAFTALISDLEERGLLRNTLVLCMGEFGRTPRINNRGGRDHWPNVWSGILAGGPVQGGRVIGSSDRHGTEPVDRPVHASEIVATVYHAFGIDPRTTITTPDGAPAPLVAAEPIGELF